MDYVCECVWMFVLQSCLHIIAGVDLHSRHEFELPSRQTRYTQIASVRGEVASHHTNHLDIIANQITLNFEMNDHYFVV